MGSLEETSKVVETGGGVLSVIGTVQPFIGAGLALIGLFRGIFGKKPKPKPPAPLSVSPRNPASSERSLPVIYGKVETLPGCAFASTQQFGTQILYTVFDISHGPIYSVGKCRFISPEDTTFRNGDGTSGSFTAKRKQNYDATTDPNYKKIPFGNGVEPYIGTETQSVNSRLTTAFPVTSPMPWSSSAAGQGIAYVVSRMVNDPNNMPWKNGLAPMAVSVVGKQLFDPRTGITGSAPLSASNPALCILDYLTNVKYGWGLPITDIHTGSFIAAANHCQESCSIPTAPFVQLRYTCDGILDTANTLRTNLEYLLTSCNGTLVPNNGQVYLYIPQSQSISGFTIYRQNTIGTHTVMSKGANDLFNEVHGFFQESSSNGFNSAEVIVPTGSVNPYLMLDNNYPLVASYQLPFTTDRYMAQRIMTIALKRNRQKVTTVRTCNESLLGVVPGDVVSVSDDTFNWVSQSMEVIKVEIPSTPNAVTLTLQTYDATDFNPMLDLAPASESINLDSPFTTPTPYGIALSATPGGDRLELTWGVTGSGDLERFEVAARKISGSAGVLSESDMEWRIFDMPPMGYMRSFIVGARNGDIWQAEVRSKNRLGVFSDWVTSSVTTVGSHELASASFQFPIISTGSVAYPVTMSSTCAYVHFYHNQGNNNAIDDPSFSDVYFAGRMDTGSSVFYISCDGANSQWFKTQIVGYNVFSEPNYSPAGTTTASFTTFVPIGAAVVASPTNASASIISSSSLRLMWTNAVTASTEVFLDGDLYATVGTLVATQSFTNLLPSSSYAMKVRHLLSGSYSGYSNIVTAITFPQTLSTPVLSGFSPGDDTSGAARANVVLNWTLTDNPPINHVQQLIERSTDGTGSWGAITTTQGTSYQDFDNAQSGILWYFRTTEQFSGYTNSLPSNIIALAYLPPTGSGGPN